MSKNNDDDNSGKVKVVCRFRPINSFEVIHGGSMDIKIKDNKNVDIKQTSKANNSKYQFTYDRVFGNKSNQKSIYEMAAKPVVESVLQGFNGTIMAYGQTASGKTYTMQGQTRPDSSLRGIIPRMVETVFEFIADSPPHVEFMVKISIIEIYMEELRDLLSIKERKKMKIRSCGTRGIFVENLTEVYVSSPEEVYKYIKIGNKNRSVGRTNMNIVSSRSHLMVSLTLHQNDTEQNIAKTGKLLLVDLAGSEKVSKSGSDGRTFEEAKKINKSLLSLGQVIYSLNEGSHIPYRDSKLTRLLEQSLGGNSKTTLIMCCSPANYNESETLSTLRFGTRAQMVQNRPVLNREYTIEQLKILLEKSKKDKETLKERVNLLEEYIKEKMPHGSWNDLEVYEKNRTKLVKTSSRLTKASTNYTLGLESPKKKFGKQILMEDGSDIEQLKQEVLEFKQKAQSLRFENEKLQKLLSESKVNSIENSSVEVNSRFSQRSIDAMSPMKSKKSNKYSGFFSPQRAEGMFKQMFDIDYGDKLIEEFDRKVTAMNVKVEVTDELREIVMKQEEKNLMLHSKLMDMRGLIEQMMKQFRELVNRDYKELQKIHKEMLLKSLRDKDKEKKSAMSRVDILNLLSVYHSENNVLKKKLNIAKDNLYKKEEIIQDERQKLCNTVQDHEAKMGRLETILSTFMQKSKEPQMLFEKIKANSHFQPKKEEECKLTMSDIQMTETPKNPRINWKKYTHSADRIKMSHTKKRRYDLLNAYESYNRTAKIIKKLKGGEPIYQSNETG